jgi:hypothetical protein
MRDALGAGVATARAALAAAAGEAAAAHDAATEASVDDDAAAAAAELLRFAFRLQPATGDGDAPPARSLGVRLIG